MLVYHYFLFFDKQFSNPEWSYLSQMHEPPEICKNPQQPGAPDKEQKICINLGYKEADHFLRHNDVRDDSFSKYKFLFFS